MAGASTLSEEETYRAIGRFIAEFSQLENILKMCVANAAGVKDEFFPAVMSHDFALTCTMALEVLPRVLQPEKHIDAVANVINGCRALNDDRVRVVHGLWRPHKKGGTLGHVSRTKLRPTFTRQQAAHLEEQADVARKLRIEIWEWYHGLAR